MRIMYHEAHFHDDGHAPLVIRYGKARVGISKVPLNFKHIDMYIFACLNTIRIGQLTTQHECVCRSNTPHSQVLNCNQFCRCTVHSHPLSAILRVEHDKTCSLLSGMGMGRQRAAWYLSAMLLPPLGPRAASLAAAVAAGVHGLGLESAAGSAARVNVGGAAVLLNLGRADKRTATVDGVDVFYGRGLDVGDAEKGDDEDGGKGLGGTGVSGLYGWG